MGNLVISKVLPLFRKEVRADIKQLNCELLPYNEEDIKTEYEHFKTSPNDYPVHLFDHSKVKSLATFKKYWNPQNLGTTFCPEIGSISFDTYFGRTPLDQIQILAKYIYWNAEKFESIGDFTSKVQDAEIREFLISFIKKGKICKYQKRDRPRLEDRESLNKKALKIDLLNNVFDTYTGKGKLHGLNFNQFGSFHEYTNAKKEIENGAFFTPYSIAYKIVRAIDPIGTVLDPTCGASIFCNYLEDESLYTGIDIDPSNVSISKKLYPDSTILRENLPLWNNRGLKFDNIITNPPFNLKWKGGIMSQSFVLRNEYLKPFGFMALVVPRTYLSDEMHHKSDLKYIEKNLSFIGQIDLGKGAFKADYDISFETKVLFFQNRKGQPYKNDFSTWEEIRETIDVLKQENKIHKITIAQDGKESGSFKQGIFNYNYFLKKVLYEIKTHRPTKKYAAALIVLNEFEQQKKEGKPTSLNWKEWEKVRITENKVLARLKMILGSNKKKRKKTERPLRPLRPFVDILPNHVQDFVNNYTFKNSKGEFKMNEIQRQDVGKAICKGSCILNWEQGVGKTVGAYAFASYRNIRAKIVLAPALAINTTWKDHFDINGNTYKILQNSNDITFEYEYLLIPYSRLSQRIARVLSKKLRSISNNCVLIVDESDELTNRNANRTRYARQAFRKVRYKLLTTGTTTRNNIAELYPQLELIYNNTLIDNTEYSYEWNTKTKELTSSPNDDRGLPFHGYRGMAQFKRAFNPFKTSVFGIKKHDQDLYNYDHLKEIIQCTSLVRTFKEVVGDKYKINHLQIGSTELEKEIYASILEEFHRLVYEHFNDTGNARKESALKLIRQLQLLIKACSMPSLFNPLAKSSKLLYISKMVAERNEKTIIGCLTKDAAKMYLNHFSNTLRPIFYIDGNTSFKKRQKILADFQGTANGIVLCTQQSLKSSINVPSCNLVIMESMNWNLPKMSQFYFRTIRFDSKENTEVVFVTIENTIEVNLLNLVMNKERVNKAVKMEGKDALEEYGFDRSALESLLTKSQDEDGKTILVWSNQQKRI